MKTEDLRVGQKYVASLPIGANTSDGGIVVIPTGTKLTYVAPAEDGFFVFNMGRKVRKLGAAGVEYLCAALLASERGEGDVEIIVIAAIACMVALCVVLMGMTLGAAPQMH